MYKINSNLIAPEIETLENSINFTQERENLFIGLNASVYETLKDSYNDKYEYIFPELTIDKNLFSNEKINSIDFQTNFKVHNYDTNRLTSFFVNDFNLETNDRLIGNIFNSKFLANIRNINYEAKNIDIYKDQTTSEIYGSIGLLSEINFKKIKDNFTHLFKPKMLLRTAPGNMREETSNSRISPDTAFRMNKFSNKDNYEVGTSAAIGFNYKVNNEEITKFDFSLAQIINDRENKKMPDRSSLNEKMSDVFGTANYKISNNFNLNYNFNIDQNYNDFNYNELGIRYQNDNNSLNLNFNYLSENKHIGDKDYFTTDLNFKNKNKGLLSFKSKRNLVTDSAEFYNLSYEYINDCLRAGLVYRREFYKDSELDPEDSLMFKVTLIPFGAIEGPTLD